MCDIEKLQQMLDQSANIVFFGGAGVSTESNIPDFRSDDGIYNQKFAYPPEVMLSHSFYENNTSEFFAFYRTMLYPHAQPNPAHLKLAQWEKEKKVTAIVTQNIDGLHQKAGSKNVYELHGSVKRNYCEKCHRFYPESAILATEGVPHCQCGGVIKPDVVLYEEGLDTQVINGAAQAIKAADMLIVGGTSLVVYPAAGLVNYYGGNKLVLINRDSTPYDNKADLIFHDSIGKIFSQLR